MKYLLKNKIMGEAICTCLRVKLAFEDISRMTFAVMLENQEKWPGPLVERTKCQQRQDIDRIVFGQSDTCFICGQ